MRSDGLQVRRTPKTGVFLKTLFCGDAGFVGFELWQHIRQHGHHFVMRVGSNVRLLRKLGAVKERGNIVYCWPDWAARKRQPPIELRLIELRLGKTPVFVVASVTDPNELSDETVRQLYALRWGIELQFRTLKQTFGRRNLLSRTPDNAYVELHWSIVGLWMIQLFAVKAQLSLGEPLERSSAALAIRVVRDIFHHWTALALPSATLEEKLQTAVLDQYTRSKESKRARYRPDTKDKPSAGKPQLLTASQRHRNLWKQCRKLTSQNP